MDECIHGCGLTIDTCVLCSGKAVAAPKPRAILPPKQVDWWIKPGFGVQPDPIEVLMAKLAAGTVCPRCLTDRLAIGCECSREQVYREDMATASEWLHKHVETLDVKQREAPHVIRSAQKRALRRVNLSESDKEDERLGLMEEWEIEPKWFPPRNNEPTHLPV